MTTDEREVIDHERVNPPCLVCGKPTRKLYVLVTKTCIHEDSDDPFPYDGARCHLGCANIYRNPSHEYLISAAFGPVRIVTWSRMAGECTQIKPEEEKDEV